MGVRYIEKETARFEAQGSDGQTYLVVETTRLAEVTTIHPDAMPQTVPSGKSYRLFADGRHVNFEDGAMTIAGTSITIKVKS